MSTRMSERTCTVTEPSEFKQHSSTFIVKTICVENVVSGPAMFSYLRYRGALMTKVSLTRPM